MIETVRRYVPKAEARALIDEIVAASEEVPAAEAANGQPANEEALAKTD